MSVRRPMPGPAGRWLCGLLLLVLLPALCRAGGAFLVNGQGKPLVWDTSQPVVWNPDQGALGLLTQAQAVQLVSDSFDVWGGVPHSALRFVAGNPLPCDVDQTNFGGPANAPCGTAPMQILGNGGDGLSPVVFDKDGLLMDALFGVGAGDCIIGFAAVVGGSFVPPLATEGEAVLNGRFFDGNTVNPELASQAAFQAVFVHEFGHWANLDHSQLNTRFLGDGDPTNDGFLPTMIPTSTDDDTQLLSLHPDDEATLAGLYPAPDLAAGTASIQGSLLEADGTTLFQGANLVLRSVDAPFLQAYSAISGNRFRPSPPSPSPIDPAGFGGPPSPVLKGAYQFAGVKPGQYTLEVEEVDPFFSGGSGVGPLNVPVFVPGPDEFWNGKDESSDPSLDSPGESSVLTVAGGDDISGIDIILNDLPPADLLYAVDDHLFDPNQSSGPGTIIE
ncbi:MAG: hypothetical protein ACE5ID_06105, partial [Acidobacteriota bacterium]